MHKQEIIQKKISNGLNIIFLKDARYTTSAILFGFNIGWRNDPLGHEGLAHLFEHLVGKRTLSYTEKSSFDKYKESLGIKTAAMTYPDYTYYLQHQSHENLNKSLDLMFESIYSSYFIEEDIVNEKKVVLNEGAEYLDNDNNFIYYKNRENLFKGTSIARFFFGNKKTLGKISLKSFEMFYEYCKNPKNSYLIIASSDSLDTVALLKDIETLFIKYNNLTNKTVPVLDEKLNQFKNKKILKRNRKQPAFMLSFRGTGIDIEDKIKFDFFRGIMSEGFNSKLIKRLRDELGLIYWTYVNLIKFNPFYEISIETASEQKNLKKLAIEIKKIINDIKNIKQEEIDTLKEIIKFNILSGINSVDDSIFALTSLIEYKKLITTEEYLEKISKTKANEVAIFVEQISKNSAETILL